MNGTRLDRVMRGVRRGVVSHVDDQKTRAADGLSGIADLVAQLGEEMPGALAQVSKTASTRLQHAADRMREHQAAELAQSLARFAHERPFVFIGGAFVLGLGLARLLNTGDEQ